MYQAFASVYDRLMSDVDYEKWADYYAGLLKSAKITTGNVCECACGTGALTIPLKKRGYRMTGIDLSGDMLLIAQEKARNAGVTIPFIRQDMCRLSLPRRQDAVLCTCDGVNYLLTNERARKFFRAAFAALKPGGALIFDVSTPEKLQSTLGNNTLSQQDMDISYIWQNAYHPRTRRVDMHLSFFVKCPDGRYERLEEEQTQRAHTMEEIKNELTEAGFAGIRFYGRMTRREPKAGDERWHICALRPRER